MKWKMGDETWHRVSTFLPGDRRQTVVMAGAGRLWLAELEKGKYLAKKSAALHKINEESLGKAFSEFTDVGDREITVVYTLPDLRVACKKFPAMTEDELEETMYWEEDRIFGTNTDLRLAWKVLNRDFTGWTVSLAGIKETSFELWQAAAEKDGRRITKLIPVTAIDVPRKQPPFYLYAGGRSAIFLFREEHRQVSRILQKETAEEKLDIFLRHLGKSYDFHGRDIIFIPLSQSEDILFWKNLADRWQEKLKDTAFEKADGPGDNFVNLEDEVFRRFEESLGEESEEHFSEKPEIDLEEGTAENLHGRKGENPEEEKTISEEMLWTLILPLMEAVDTSSMDFCAKKKRTRFFWGQIDWLRIGQGISACFAIISILCFLFFGYILLEERTAERKLAELSPMRGEMEAEQKARTRENTLLSQLKSLEGKDLHWEQKLVFLAEYTPRGIVLSEIKSDGNTVHLTGTADSPGTVAKFQKELEKVWGGKVLIEEEKQDPKLKMAVFTLLWEGGRHE